MRSLAAAVGALLLLSACEKNPVDRLANPVPNGAVPQSSGIFVIYDDELKTGGGVALLAGAENQFIDLNDRSTPSRSRAQIRYVWNGNDVGGQHLFGGFQLVITPNGSTLASATGKNLTAANYGRLTFFVRGNLSSDTILRIEGPDAGLGGTPARTEVTALSNNWTQVTLSGIPSGDFANVKIFVTFSFQFTQAPRTTNPGGGGEIFVDDIQYEQ